MKLSKAVITWTKFAVYTFLFVLGTDIVNANTIQINWKSALVGAVVATIKAVMTYVKTPEV